MDIMYSGGRIVCSVESHGMYGIIHGDGEMPISRDEK